MELTVAGLALGSAVLHPLREMLIKRNAYPEGLCIAIFIMWVFFSAGLALVLGLDLMSAWAVWPLIVASSIAILLYHYFIVVVLRNGEISVYYPIARSYPLLIVVVGLLFLGHDYSQMMLAGLGLTLIGAYFLQYRHGAGLIHDPKTLAFAGLAMASSAAYSLTDAQIMQSVEPTVFFFWDALLILPGAIVLFSVTKPDHRSAFNHLFGGWRLTPGRYLAAGLSTYASYFLILTAYKLGGNVAAVNSVRQTSVLLSVILGGILLRESNIRWRLIWALLLVSGIVIIILSK